MRYLWSFIWHYLMMFLLIDGIHAIKGWNYYPVNILSFKVIHCYNATTEPNFLLKIMTIRMAVLIYIKEVGGIVIAINLIWMDFI